MRSFINIIFYIGFLFFGGGFLIALGQFILYNGIGDIFEYTPSDKSIIVEKRVDRMPNQIVYQYFIENEKYNGSQNISSTIISKIDPDSIIVLYNKSFNNFSMIQGVAGKSSKSRDQITGIIIMGFFFLFIFLIYKFSDKEKWIGVYTRGEYKSSKEK